MAQGVHFTQQLKEMFFRMIDLVESEKSEPQIPMNNATARNIAMLGISEPSLWNLNKKINKGST